MNKVELVARLVRDPEVRYSTGENASAVARFSVAVNRRFKNAEGGYDADFPSVVAFGKTAEFAEKYFHKGDMIGIVGRIQTGNYTNKDGQKIYTTDVVADEVEFVGGKGSNDTTATTPNSPARTNNDFVNVPDTGAEELPF